MSSGFVITAAAAVGPHGTELEALDAALRAGRPLCTPAGPAPLPERPRRSKVQASCRGLDLSPWLAPRVARRMSLSSQWAVVAGKIALAAARWEGGDPSRLAVCTATCFGPTNFTRQLLAQILLDRPTSASPMLFTDCVANAPSGQLAIAVQARAANITVCQREAGPLLAVGHALSELRCDRADAVVVEAVDELDEYQVTIFDRMGALAHDAEQVRPLDRRSRGYLLGEGASSVVVEREHGARARGVAPLCRIVAAARGFDPTAPRSGWGTGADPLASRLRAALSAAGIEPDSIGAVVSGASGAPSADSLECAVLRRVFGTRVPAVLLPKAVLGEYGGGTLVPGVLALRGGRFERPVHFVEAHPQVGIEPFAGELRAPGRVLITALASGGAAAWVVLESS